MMGVNAVVQKRTVRVRRFSITLIEMIVVMILIATITGALAYNYKDSLNEGKAFKTKEGMARMEAIITIFLAEHPDSDPSNTDWEKVIRNSPLVKDPNGFLKDGWGSPYEIRVVSEEGGETRVMVRSQEYERYQQKKGYK